jgi:ubiquinone/menaquinone biosynthesis C-methylase UbiE
MDATSQMKDAMKWMWSLGEYRELARWLQPSAEALEAACGVHPGMEVLDVAAGNGNFAVAAARRGAAVTACDLTPRMVQLGRERSQAQGLAIGWLEADAEQLPFATDRFDLVASVFGAMFAPRPERVAAELFRVARPGGRVAMANYSSDGFLGRISELLRRYGPSAPVEVPSPFQWGDPDEVHRRFQGLASWVEVAPRTLTFAFDSPAEGWAFWERTNPPQIALRTMLPANAYQHVQEQGTRLMQELNRADDGRLVLDSGYLLVLARKASKKQELPPGWRAGRVASQPAIPGVRPGG